jgi:ribonuclease HI
MGCRATLGLLKTAPSASCLAENGLRSFTEMMEEQGVRAAQKFLRLPPEHPTRCLLLAKPPDVQVKGTVIPTFRNICGPMLTPLEDHLWSLPYKAEDTAGAAKVSFFLPSTRTTCGRNAAVAEKLAESTALLNRAYEGTPVGAELWLDGSVKPATDALPIRSAGVALLYTDGVDTPRILSKAAGAYACSFTAEGKGFAAIAMAIPHIPLACRKLVIASDSLSNLSALARGPLRQRHTHLAEVWKTLLTLSDMEVALVFVFGHCGMTRNEAADQAASAAADTYTGHQPPIWSVDAARYIVAPIRAAILSFLVPGLNHAILFFLVQSLNHSRDQENPEHEK